MTENTETSYAIPLPNAATPNATALQSPEHASARTGLWRRLKATVGIRQLTRLEAETNALSASESYLQDLRSIRFFDGISAAGSMASQVREHLDKSIKNLHKHQKALSKFDGYYPVMRLKYDYIGETIGVEWTNNFRELGVRIHYMDSKEREKYRVHIDQKGKFLRADGRPLNGTAIFVMDQSGGIYASTDSREMPASKAVRHSSFLAGQSVAAAGQMELDYGTPTMINRRTGHYAYRRAIKSFFQELNRKGVDVSKIRIEKGF